MASRTEFDKIEIFRDGTVQVRMRKIITDQNGVDHQIGGENHFHRFVLPPGITASSQKDILNSSLAALNAPPISDSEIAEIDSMRAVIQTTKRIQAYNDKINLRTIGV